jgi:hypothetical protein
MKSAVNGGAEEFQSPDQKIDLFLFFDVSFKNWSEVDTN